MRGAKSMRVLSYQVFVLLYATRWLGVLCGTPETSIALPLRTRGRYIIDANGDRVKLACVNWYGAHMKTFVQNGLTKRTPEDIAVAIAALGFNCVRLSYSLEAHKLNPTVQSAYISMLRNTTGRAFLDVFDETIHALTSHDLMVIINNHNSDAGWCCEPYDGNGLWFNDKYTESDWIASLKDLAKRYRGNPYVIGYDLRNEVRPDLVRLNLPSWGDIDPIISPGFRSFTIWDWRLAAERAGTAVLEEDPEALIVVEILFAMSLCPHLLSRFPLRGLDGHVVWSAHEYTWHENFHRFAWPMCEAGFTSADYAVKYAFYLVLVFVRDACWPLIFDFYGPVCATLITIAAFGGMALGLSRVSDRTRTCIVSCALVPALLVLAALLAAWIVIPCRPIDSYEAFAASRDASWGYIARDGLGPVWVAEFGQDKPDLSWNWTISYLRYHDLDFAYWSIDGEHFPAVAVDFGDHVEGQWQDEVYGLLKGDYRSIRHPWKLKDVQSLMGTLNSSGAVCASADCLNESIAAAERPHRSDEL